MIIMFKDTIPQDVKEYARKEIIKSAIICFIILLSEGVILFLLWDSVRQKLNNVSMGLLCALLFVLPFFFSGLVRKLRDRSWVGVILDVHKKTTFGNTSMLSRGGAYKMFVIEATMRMEDSSIDVKTVYSGPAEQSQTWLYKEGTVIRHVRGCKHLQVLNEGETDTVTCVVCGREEEKSEVDICKKCKHTLIR